MPTATPHPQDRTATLIGCAAIAIWGTLALLTDLASAIPAFQLVAMAFAIGTIPGIVNLIVTCASPRTLREVPGGAWLLGVGGPFGYHFFYFIALREAPAVEANLINYLWPLLIVLFSSLPPGHRLHWWHVAGGALGMGGRTGRARAGASQGDATALALPYGAIIQRGCQPRR